MRKPVQVIENDPWWLAAWRVVCMLRRGEWASATEELRRNRAPWRVMAAVLALLFVGQGVAYRMFGFQETTAFVQSSRAGVGIDEVILTEDPRAGVMWAQNSPGGEGAFSCETRMPYLSWLLSRKTRVPVLILQNTANGRVRFGEYLLLPGVPNRFTLPRIAAGFSEELSIHFAFDRATVDEEDLPQLDAVAGRMKSDRSLLLLVEAHTDRQGSDDYNRHLAAQRAEAVIGQLVKLGVPRTKIVAASFGKSKLVDGGLSENANRANRRVEFVYLPGSKIR